MISALQYGKISTQIIEDSLTSSVFDHLLLFPDELFYKIIKESCYNNSLPEIIGDIDYYEFWPHWDATNTTRTSYIEPDLFLRFDNFDLIIEAKRWDHNQQYLTQWKNEFIAYKNEYAEEDKDVFLLAIGGINNEDEENIMIDDYGKITIIKCRWSGILETLTNILNELEQSYYVNNNNIKRIVLLTINALELHGYIKVKWFDDLVGKYNIDYYNNLVLLNNWRI
ncbi:hypothetical protein AGMMS49940_07320 [Spirochaetia bacterium]|nr:hypothetical protein AGMMS49940_07320 [Spirochaetia bacterium]